MAENRFRNRTGTGSDQGHISNPGAQRDPEKGGVFATGCEIGEAAIFIGY